MVVYTDSTTLARQLLSGNPIWRPAVAEANDSAISILRGRLFRDRAVFEAHVDIFGAWQHLMLVDQAPASQYDAVVSLCQQDVPLPDGLLCLAGSGREFHGQRNRGWAALPGNIHLTAHLTPNQKVSRVGVGFTVLAAVSVIHAIDTVEGLQNRAKIKWVNDILIDGGKVAGFLTHTLSLEGVVTAAVVGIGLNVETTPDIVPDRYISRAAALRDFVPDPRTCNLRAVLKGLIDALGRNYHVLIGGGFSTLLDTYRKHSMIVGREVEIFTDPASGDREERIAGRVTGIGDNLELFLAGRERPVTRGRLRLKT